VRKLRAKERGSDGGETRNAAARSVEVVTEKVQIPIDVLLRSVQSTSDGDLSTESAAGERWRLGGLRKGRTRWCVGRWVAEIVR